MKVEESENIVFTVGESELTFENKDGLFNIRYNPNDVTEACKTFCKAMELYLNQYIQEKAEELLKEKENVTIRREVKR